MSERKGAEVVATHLVKRGKLKDDGLVDGLSAGMADFVADALSSVPA